ncbi:MAG: AIR synthase-related protein, partial [Bdellovibrionota bacterium]
CGASPGDGELLWQMVENLQDMRARYETIHQAILDGVVVSAHDLSDGGLAVALAEILMQSKGLALDCALPVPVDANVLFGEGPFRILLGVPQEKRAEFESRFPFPPHPASGVSLGTHVARRSCASYIHYLATSETGHELKIHAQNGPMLLQMAVSEMSYFWHRRQQ